MCYPLPSGKGYFCFTRTKNIEKKGNMQMKSTNKKLKSLLIMTVLIFALAFSIIGCKKNDEADNSKENPKTTEATNSNNSDDKADNSKNDSADDNVLGEGKTKFNFTVVDKAGDETTFEIHTDKKTVGDALLEHKLIEGEEGDYGLYVKKVNGILADYDKDQTYWAFYIDGEYAMTGVDKTDIEEGKTYTFKVEK